MIEQKKSKYLSFDFKSFLNNTPNKSGVYEMISPSRKTLYIGKAKDLKKRLSNYFNNASLDNKTISLVHNIYNIHIIVTHSEIDALILEQNLIKEKKPKYNILLKDDKSYPYIVLSQHEFPALRYQRKKKLDNHENFFGPYPNQKSIKESLNLLQKIFKLRQCSDVFYNNRSRPCLQYQINRCKAPCVNLVTQKEYKRDIIDTIYFLKGRDQKLIRNLIKRMELESEKLNFESATVLRDQIYSLRQTQELQISESGSKNTDIIGYYQTFDLIFFHILIVRHGRILGSKDYVINIILHFNIDIQISDFINQYYFSFSRILDYPDEIITPFSIENKQVFCDAIYKKINKKILVKNRQNGIYHRWREMALKNAKINYQHYILKNNNYKNRIDSLTELLNLSRKIKKIECFDISHIFGEETVASCVVFDNNGPLKSEYRFYNVDDVKKSDDYASMEFALKKRYKNLMHKKTIVPDLIIIDGGKGQLNKARSVLENLGFGNIPILGVAKGITRKAGFEKLIYHNKVLNTEKHSVSLSLIQFIRDEAHRFAISKHRMRRSKSHTQSKLENIPGIGKKRRIALLNFFGGYSVIEKATVEELVKVENISLRIAKQIYDYFNA